jgi:hypothetical protein
MLVEYLPPLECPPIFCMHPCSACTPPIPLYSLAVQPRYTASPHLSPIVLSRTGGLRGLPPIGWLTRYGPHRPTPSSYSGSGLVVLVRARGLASRGPIGARTSVRRNLIGRIPGVPTGVCYWGD